MSELLKTRVLETAEPADGTPVVVLMHGRGADENDLVPVGRAFLETATVVLPQAPHPGRKWGYGPGWAWYRYDGGTKPEPDSFRASQEALGRLLDQLPDLLGREPGPVILGGFSQGGTMALGYALGNPGAAAGVLVFSGFLADHADVSLEDASVAPPIWWGHGTRDPAVRFEWALEGRAALEHAGAELETRDYPMGHGITPAEVDDAFGWLERTLGRTGEAGAGASEASRGGRT